jgi:hypothetical protein
MTDHLEALQLFVHQKADKRKNTFYEVNLRGKFSSQEKVDICNDSDK